MKGQDEFCLRVSYMQVHSLICLCSLCARSQGDGRHDPDIGLRRGRLSPLHAQLADWERGACCAESHLLCPFASWFLFLRLSPLSSLLYCSCVLSPLLLLHCLLFVYFSLEMALFTP